MILFVINHNGFKIVQFNISNSFYYMFQCNRNDLHTAVGFQFTYNDNSYTTFLKALEREPHPQMQFSVIPRGLIGESYPLFNRKGWKVGYGLPYMERKGKPSALVGSS